MVAFHNQRIEMAPVNSLQAHHLHNFQPPSTSMCRWTVCLKLHFWGSRVQGTWALTLPFRAHVPSIGCLVRLHDSPLACGMSDVTIKSSPFWHQQLPAQWCCKVTSCRSKQMGDLIWITCRKCTQNTSKCTNVGNFWHLVEGQGPSWGSETSSGSRASGESDVRLKSSLTNVRHILTTFSMEGTVAGVCWGYTIHYIKMEQKANSYYRTHCWDLG